MELNEIKFTQNENKDELINAILTRTQGSNAWKNKVFRKKYTASIREALSEFESLIY